MSKMNVLVIEDESLMALELAGTVSAYGYNVVDYVTTIESATQIINEKPVDLLLLDINLNSSIDGIDFYKNLHKEIDVIYLTAYKDEKTISKAIQTQPLGYLTKPHKESELFALLKLAEIKLSEKNDILNLNDRYKFDRVENKLYYQEKFIKLSIKELKLLNLLIDAKQNIVTFHTIEYELWEMPPSPSALRTLIYRLRVKLNHKFIVTENKHGIKLLY